MFDSSFESLILLIWAFFQFSIPFICTTNPECLSHANWKEVVPQQQSLKAHLKCSHLSCTKSSLISFNSENTLSKVPFATGKQYNSSTNTNTFFHLLSKYFPPNDFVVTNEVEILPSILNYIIPLLCHFIHLKAGDLA